MHKGALLRGCQVFGIATMLALISACGGAGGSGGAAQATPPPATAAATTGAGEQVVVSAEAGDTLFHKQLLGTGSTIAAGCITCHYVEADKGNFTGPNLAGIATRAGSTVPGQSAEEYIRTSIVNPNDHTVEGFSAGVMPPNYGDVLSDPEIDSLVAYLMTLE